MLLNMLLWRIRSRCIPSGITPGIIGKTAMLFPHFLVEGRTMSGSGPFYYYCLSQSNAHNQLCGDLNAKTPKTGLPAG